LRSLCARKDAEAVVAEFVRRPVNTVTLAGVGELGAPDAPGVAVAVTD
jgi:hypothetical protein